MQWQEFRTSIRHLPAQDIERIERAFTLGKTVHADQKRKSGEPYFNHPIAVARMLIDMGADADTVIAALLHDTVEDTPLTLQEIDRLFDGNTATLIDGVTKLGVRDLEDSPRLNEQMETLRKIFTLMQEDVRIMVIKIVDRLHNMQTVEFLSKERQLSLAKETLDIYVKIADKLCMQDIRDELEALCLAILEPENYAGFTKARVQNEQRGQKIMEEMYTKVRAQNAVLGSRIQMSYEYKKWDQLRSQLTIGDNAVATGKPMITIALVCENVDACYQVLGTLHQLWKREVLSFQDFINAPQINGYQGLHTTIIAQDGTRVRCKIRTFSMQDYARKGIVTKCFDSKAQGIGTYLPWTERLTPLTADTQGSSDDFWQALQSDILGESITIHGPDDSTIQLPRNASALDGAFYFLKEEALYTKSVKINGVDVPFDTRLTNAASIDVTLSRKITCSLDWLHSVQTGFASALIRTTLAKQSDEKKLHVGKQLLQRTFSERKKGFIEEFEEKGLLPQLESMGFSSMKEAYMAISDGRIEADDVYTSLFEKKVGTNASTDVPAYVITYEADIESLDLMDRLNAVHRMYGNGLTFIRYKRKRNSKVVVTINANLPSPRLHSFLTTLKTAGALHLKAEPITGFSSILIASLVVMLWGLDAVLTKFILTAGVSPLTFTLVRSWSCFGFALIVVLLIRNRDSMLRIPFFHPLLWLSGLAFFFVNILTNYTLSETTPFFYKTVLRFSAPLLAMHFIFSKKSSWKSYVSLFLSLLGIMSLFFIQEDVQAVILALAMVGVFVIYTKASSRFQESAHIGIRYPQYFLAISAISALVSFFLFLIGKIVWPSPELLAAIIGFSALFVCVPYMLFYQLHRTLGYYKLSPYFHLSIVITFISQWAILGIFDGIVLLPCIIFIGASMLAPKTNIESPLLR